MYKYARRSYDVAALIANVPYGFWKIFMGLQTGREGDKELFLFY